MKDIPNIQTYRFTRRFRSLIKSVSVKCNYQTPDLLQLLTKSNHYNSNYFLEVNVMITITITFVQNKNDYNYNYFKVGKIQLLKIFR